MMFSWVNLEIILMSKDEKNIEASKEVLSGHRVYGRKDIIIWQCCFVVTVPSRIVAFLSEKDFKAIKLFVLFNSVLDL